MSVYYKLDFISILALDQEFKKQLVALPLRLQGTVQYGGAPPAVMAPSGDLSTELPWGAIAIPTFVCIYAYENFSVYSSTGGLIESIEASSSVPGIFLVTSLTSLQKFKVRGSSAAGTPIYSILMGKLAGT